MKIRQTIPLTHYKHFKIKAIKQKLNKFPETIPFHFHKARYKKGPNVKILKNILPFEILHHIVFLPWEKKVRDIQRVGNCFLLGALSYSAREIMNIYSPD